MNDTLVSFNNVEETNNLINEIRLNVNEELLIHSPAGVGIGSMILRFLNSLF